MQNRSLRSKHHAWRPAETSIVSTGHRATSVHCKCHADGIRMPDRFNRALDFADISLPTSCVPPTGQTSNCPATRCAVHSNTSGDPFFPVAVYRSARSNRPAVSCRPRFLPAARNPVSSGQSRLCGQSRLFLLTAHRCLFILLAVIEPASPQEQVDSQKTPSPHVAAWRFPFPRAAT